MRFYFILQIFVINYIFVCVCVSGERGDREDGGVAGDKVYRLLLFLLNFKFIIIFLLYIT